MQTLVVDLPVVFLNTAPMFLRAHKRLKDGKEHRYWSIVENRRVQGNRVVQRQVLYLGEINDSQKTTWCKTIDVVMEDARSRQIAIFPQDLSLPKTPSMNSFLFYISE